MLPSSPGKAQSLDRRRCRRRRCEIELTIVLSLRRPILVGEERLMRLTRYTKEIKCVTKSIDCRSSPGKLTLSAFLGDADDDRSI